MEKNIYIYMRERVREEERQKIGEKINVINN